MTVQTSVVLQPIPSDFVTAYTTGGRTRGPGGSILHISRLLPVGRTSSRLWRLSPGTLRALEALQKEWVACGGEPLRLVDALREAEAAARLRRGWELWRDAGRPTPEDPLWRNGMKMAYVAPPDGTFHQAGMAIDFHVAALFIEGHERGSDIALQKLWEVMERDGFAPVIAHPIADQSEAWHLDHMGPLRVVYDHLRGKYRGAYSETARMACALAGTLHSETRHPTERYVQARLSVAGFMCGKADGVIGRMTRKALSDAECPKAIREKARRNPSDVVSWMNEVGLGVEQIAEL